MFDKLINNFNKNSLLDTKYNKYKNTEMFFKKFEKDLNINISLFYKNSDIINSIKENKGWYLVYDLKDNPSSYVLNKGNIQDVLANSNYHVEFVNNEQWFSNFLKANQIINATRIKYFEDREDYLNYNFETFLFYILTSENIEKEANKNINNKFLNKKENFQMLIDVLKLFDIEIHNELSKEQLISNIILSDENIVNIWGEEEYFGEYSFCLITKETYYKIKNIDKEIIKNVVDANEIMKGLIVKDDDERIEKYEGFITYVGISEWNKYNEHICIKGSYISKFINRDEIKYKDEFVYTWIE